MIVTVAVWRVTLALDGVKAYCCNDILNASEYQEVRRTKEFLLFNRSTLKSSWEVTKRRFRFERFVIQVYVTSHGKCIMQTLTLLMSTLLCEPNVPTCFFSEQ